MNRLQAFAVLLFILFLENILPCLPIIILDFYLYLLILSRRCRDINYKALIPVSILAIAPLIIILILSFGNVHKGMEWYRELSLVVGIAGLAVYSLFWWAMLLLLIGPGSPGWNRFGPPPVGLDLMSMIAGGDPNAAEENFAPWRTKEERHAGDIIRAPETVQIKNPRRPYKPNPRFIGAVLVFAATVSGIGIWQIISPINSGQYSSISVQEIDTILMTQGVVLFCMVLTVVVLALGISYFIQTRPIKA